MKSISIIVRCYNEEEHLARLLTGLARQSLKAEVIVVDSGSTDASPAIATRYGARLLNIPKSEFSFGRSLNLGCQMATGQVLVSISAHCYPISSDWLESLIRPFADRKVAFSYGMQRGDDTSQLSEANIFRQWFAEASDFNQSTPFANNANSAFLRSVWEDLRFDEMLTGLEDLDFASRAMKRGHRVAYVAEAPVIHVHKESWSQVYNRYRREAIAMRQIMPQASFGPRALVSSLMAGVFQDLKEAISRRQLYSELLNILRFRCCQYFGAFRGFRDHSDITESLHQIFYFPLRPMSYSSDQPTLSSPIDYSAVAEQKHALDSDPWVDISTPISSSLPVWPGDSPPDIEQVMSLDAGDEATVSRLSMSVHTGTHIDAPAHFIRGGKTVDSISPDRLIGPATVMRFFGEKIDADDLAEANIPAGCRRLLLRTNNSALWSREDGFHRDYVGITPAAAERLLEIGVDVIGIDYLSIERFDEPNNQTHHILLKAGVVVIEGLNLYDVEPGEYELICLPLHLEKAEGAPARAVLRRRVSHVS